MSAFLIVKEMVSHSKFKSRKQSKAFLWFCLSCKCWAFPKPFLKFLVALQNATCVPLSQAMPTNCSRHFWCKHIRVRTSHSSLCSSLCVAQTELLLSALAFRKWYVLGLQSGSPMLLSHLSPCTSPSKLPSLRGRACESNIIVLHFLFFFFSSSSFVDESIYCTNIGRALERLKQYRSGLITTVNVPRTWSTDQRIFMHDKHKQAQPPRLFGGRPSLPKEGHRQLWAFCQHAAFSFAIFMQWVFNIYSFRFDTALLMYSDCFGFFRDLPEEAGLGTGLSE